MCEICDRNHVRQRYKETFMGTIHKTVKEVMELLSMLPEDLSVGGEGTNEESGFGIEKSSQNSSYL